MLPSIDIRINSLIKAMEKTVIPALDVEASLALEQAALIVKHLQVINQQWDGAYLFEQGSLNQLKALAGSLLARLEGGIHTTQSGLMLQNALDSIPDVLPATVAGINPYIQTVGNAIDAVINSAFIDGSDSFNLVLSDSILAYGDRQTLRERTWFQATGLDPDHKDLTSITEMLKTDSAL